LVNPIPCFFQGTYLLTGLDLFEDSAKFIDTDRDKIQQLCADVDRPGAGVDERICFQVVVVVMAMDYPSGKIQGCLCRIMDQAELRSPAVDHHAGDGPGNHFVMVSRNEMDSSIEACEVCGCRKRVPAMAEVAEVKHFIGDADPVVPVLYKDIIHLIGGEEWPAAVMDDISMAKMEVGDQELPGWSAMLALGQLQPFVLPERLVGPLPFARVCRFSP